MTSAPGALSAASETRSANPCRRSIASCSVAATASIAPPRRQLSHQPAAGRDQRAGVLQGEHPRHVGGRELADRVPDQVVRAQAEGRDEPVEGDLEREQRRLGELRAVEQLRLL